MHTVPDDLRRPPPSLMRAAGAGRWAGDAALRVWRHRSNRAAAYGADATLVPPGNHSPRALPAQGSAAEPAARPAPGGAAPLLPDPADGLATPGH